MSGGDDALAASNAMPAAGAQEQLAGALGPIAQRLTEVLKGLDRVQLKFLLEALAVPDYVQQRAKKNQKGQSKQKWTDEELQATLRNYVLSEITIASVQRTIAEASLQEHEGALALAAARLLSGLGQNARSILRSTVPLGAAAIATSTLQASPPFLQSLSLAHLSTAAHLAVTTLLKLTGARGVHVHVATGVAIVHAISAAMAAIPAMSAVMAPRRRTGAGATGFAVAAAGVLAAIGLGGSAFDGVRAWHQNRKAVGLGQSAARLARVHEELRKALQTRTVDAALYHRIRDSCRTRKIPGTCRWGSVRAGGKTVRPCEWREEKCRVKRDYKLLFKESKRVSQPT